MEPLGNRTSTVNPLPTSSHPNSTDKPTETPSLEKNSDTTAFLVSLAINGLIAFIVLFLFSLLRRKLKKIYSPRLILLEGKFPLGKLPRSFFSWVIPSLMAKDDDVFYYAGFDALVYIRFLKLCIKISAVILPYGVAVLLPLNIYGGHHGTGLPKMTLSNLLEDSPKMWAHFVAVWVYTFIICYLLYEEWKVFIIYRQEYLAKGLHHQYAVLVRDLPARLCNEENMKSHVDTLFPNQVEDVTMVEELGRWESLVSKHDKLVWKLEKAKFELERTGERPSYKSNVFDEERDAITYYENELKKLQLRLEDEMHQDHLVYPCSFVIFKSLKFANQSLVNNSPLRKRKKAFPAPSAAEVVWENLKLNPAKRTIRYFLVMVIVLWIVIFYFIPVGFVSSLIALDRLTDLIPFLSEVNKLPSLIKNFLEGFLSSLALLIFFAILPMVLRYLSKMQGLVSLSEVEQATLSKLFIFKVVNQFLFLTAGSALKELEIMIKKPDNIPMYLGTTLPSLSSFFLSYLMLCSFTVYPMELLRPVPLLIYSLKKKFFHPTPREERESWRPPAVPYDALFADHLLVLIIGLCFSVMAPLVSIFVLFYFGFGYVVWMYQILCVYIPTYSCGGMMWPVVFKRYGHDYLISIITSLLRCSSNPNEKKFFLVLWEMLLIIISIVFFRIIASVVVFHLVMIGIFGLKDLVSIPSLLTPLPIMTILFYLYMMRSTAISSAFLSDAISADLPEANPSILQAATKQYVRNHKLPSQFSLSTDSSTENLTGYQEIPEATERSPLLVPVKPSTSPDEGNEDHFQI